MIVPRSGREDGKACPHRKLIGLLSKTEQSGCFLSLAHTLHGQSHRRTHTLSLPLGPALARSRFREIVSHLQVFRSFYQYAEHSWNFRESWNDWKLFTWISSELTESHLYWVSFTCINCVSPALTVFNPSWLSLTCTDCVSPALTESHLSWMFRSCSECGSLVLTKSHLYDIYSQWTEAVFVNEFRFRAAQPALLFFL